jgi:hypothetical protein
MLAHQRDHHRHRAEQADRGRTAALPRHVAGPFPDPGGQLLELLMAQPCENLIPQRLLPVSAFSPLWYSWQEPFSHASTGT